MRKRLKILLLFWIVLNSFLFVLSFIKVRGSGDEVTFILWASLFGAFVWEDLLIFSIFNVLATTFIYLIRDFRFLFIVPLCFWLIRSLGETFYWFLQQFNQPVEYPHSEYSWSNNEWMKSLFGDLSDQKYFILYQISWQVISVLCIVGFVYTLKNWESIGKRINN